MQTASVWDWDNLRYDYYLIDGPANLGGFRRLDGLGLSAPRTDSKSMGIDIEDALPTLPPNARKTGSGPTAKGTIYKIRGAVGLSNTPNSKTAQILSSPFIPAILGASTALLASRFIPKDKAALAILFIFGLSTGLGIGMNHARYQQVGDE